MPYLGKSMSTNAAAAHRKGLLPISSITPSVLKANNFKYPKKFFDWLCKQGYFRPTEFHHASAAKKMVSYYDPKWIKVVALSYDLENLYSLYRCKITRAEIYRKKSVEYVKALVSGKNMGLSRPVELFCIKVNDLVLWSQNTALDPFHSKVVENYGYNKPMHWKNPNKDRILRRVIVFKYLKVKNYL